jgi:hypothetical protein
VVTALLVLTSIWLFFASAKAHGRQLRLEREFEGHYSVEFGGKNHAWVEALWKAERFRFWGLTVVCEIGLLVVGVISHSASWKLGLVAIGWIPSLAFTVTGGLSLWRLLQAMKLRNRNASTAQSLRPNWVVNAMIGSAGWWVLVLILGVAAAFLS